MKKGQASLKDIAKALNISISTVSRALRGTGEVNLDTRKSVLELAGEFPAVNSVIPCGDFDFTVMQTDSNRIQLVKVTIKPKE